MLLRDTDFELIFIETPSVKGTTKDKVCYSISHMSNYPFTIEEKEKDKS